MAVTQSAYSETQPVGYNGMIATEVEFEAITGIVETVAGIGVGKACSQGTADKGVVLGAAAATAFMGISVADPTIPAGNAGLFLETENIPLVNRGEVWVTTGGDVVAGGDVTFDATTGVLSSIAADGSNFTIAGARWMTSAASGALARLRLSGNLPSA